MNANRIFAIFAAALIALVAFGVVRFYITVLSAGQTVQEPEISAMASLETAVRSACSTQWGIGTKQSGDCYARVFKDEPQEWSEVSGHDDDPANQFLTFIVWSSNNLFKDGRVESASLALSCSGAGQPAVIFNLPMASRSSDLTIGIKLDAGPFSAREMDAHNNSQNIRKLVDDEAIAFLKSMNGKSHMEVGYRLGHQNTYNYRFNISGLDEHLPKLQEACGW